MASTPQYGVAARLESAALMQASAGHESKASWSTQHCYLQSFSKNCAFAHVSLSPDTVSMTVCAANLCNGSIHVTRADLRLVVHRSWRHMLMAVAGSQASQPRMMSCTTAFCWVHVGPIRSCRRARNCLQTFSLRVSPHPFGYVRFITARVCLHIALVGLLNGLWCPASIQVILLAFEACMLSHQHQFGD